LQQAARSQEIDVSERGEKEQALDAAGEADEVHQKIAAVFDGADFGEAIDGIDPAKAEFGFLAD
jgi:hypothetical protein